MNLNGVSYLVSYDGRTGEKHHGKSLPSDLELRHLEIYAGKSSQATFLGKHSETVESLYLSAGSCGSDGICAARCRWLSESRFAGFEDCQD